MSRQLTVVILAAGQGTRMKSDLPKVLHRVGGKPMLERVYESARALKPDAIHIVYGHGGERVKACMSHLDARWEEQAEQLGTGHAVDQALPRIDDGQTVLVLYGDVPLIGSATLERLVEASAGNALGLLTAELDDPTGYGRILRDAAGRVQSIVEQKDATPAQLAIGEVNTGMMAVNAGLLRGWLGNLDNDNAQGEYYLTDVIARAVKDGIAVNAIATRDLAEIEGVNDRLQLARLERVLQRRQAERLMYDGVTLRDPARFDLRGRLDCGQDVEIDVNVVFEGHVVLGDRCYVGPNCLLKDVVIGDDARIEANCVLESSSIGDRCLIGPFARLRPECDLAEGVKVGNFVEVKKSAVEAGSKINHLSYVGDTLMGANVNVGAGTITCNYDGANKHLTVIGDDVFIGSDSQLVAPVTIGSGATIGAGSTITRDVPADQLTLSRSPQQTRRGWKRPVKKKP